MFSSGAINDLRIHRSPIILHMCLHCTTKRQQVKKKKTATREQDHEELRGLGELK